MSVMAAAMAQVAVITLLLDRHGAAYSSVFELLGLNGMSATLFAGSALLFRRASARRNSSWCMPRHRGGSPASNRSVSVASNHAR